MMNEAADRFESLELDDVNKNLTQAVFEILESTEPGSPEFDRWLQGLEAEFGTEIYAHLLSLLCHLRFSPNGAKRHWHQVVEHRSGLEEKLGRSVDLRVALASYFIHVHQELKNPTLIEMRLFERTKAFAYRDELTGLRNYRFFKLYLFHELDRSTQYCWPASLLLIDVDDFKPYNDRHGHVAGNEALTKLAEVILSCCRRVDVAARYGGEEFAIILPSTPKLGAEAVAERIRERVVEEAKVLDGLTVSIGLATHPGDAESAELLIRRADEAMYVAKDRGKNQVARYGDNRRSHRRFPVKMEGRLLAPGEEWSRFTTIDASEGGLCVTSESALEANDLVDMRLSLPSGKDDLTIAARVVRSNRADDGAYRTSVRLIEISNQDRHGLSMYLRAAEAAERLSEESEAE